MTIQQCVYVIKIAECGSFSEAAKQLFVAQSSISVSVKALEKELNIKIFERVGNGVFLTNDGAEFLRYAHQIVEQSEFISNRFSNNKSCRRLYISTQHYDFVADIFTKLINDNADKNFSFSLREMTTYDVINAIETACSDIGVIAIKETDYTIMDRYLSQRGISFNSFLKVLPHVYVRKEHPVATNTEITFEKLKYFPYVTYEQGEHNNSFFTEELANISSEKQIEISDRATLMNCLLGTDSYTIGTGIMPSLLNDGRIVSLPFKSEDCYMIGYILRTDKSISELTQKFIDILKDTNKN